MTSPIAELADSLNDLLLAASPFTASMMGLPGHDAEVPDASPDGDARLRGQLDEVDLALGAIDLAALDLPDRITAAATASTSEQTRLALDMAVEDHTVTAMPFEGPPVFLAVVARTIIADAAAADDFVARLEASGGWIDQLIERLRSGAAAGRVPVGSLVADAVAWADSVLASPVPAPLLAPQGPAGWDGADAWRDRVVRAGVDVVRPALTRWRALLADELLPVARGADAVGLLHLPGGVEDYARAVRLHTTLDLTPQQLHQIGLEQIAELEDRALSLGAAIGLTDLPSIHAAMRAASSDAEPGEAVQAASDAVRRAEARAAEIFPAPLPPPCVVEPMEPMVAESGMAPHYTPPRLDGGRAGTFWFNTMRPTAGSGWDLEAVAFHEAVPGHHLQLSRVQLFTELPALQRQRSVTVHSEGWGLYAEQLADEIGLYSGVEAQLGAISASLMRAARLVLDTGIHALGWTRQQALDYYIEHVPMPVEFLGNEIDRYIVMPGQALAYMTGRREILRLREQAKSQLGSRFSLPDFHAAVLDSGSLPMPALQTAVAAWADSLG